MKNEDFNCPIPLNDADCVLMAHGVELYKDGDMSDIFL